MPDTLVRAVNAVASRLPGWQREDWGPSEELPQAWQLPDSSVHQRAVADLRLARCVERLVGVIFAQSIIIAALLIVLFGFMEIRWR